MAEQYDYDSIKSRILTNLSNKSEHQSVFENSAIVLLIEALSEELEDEMQNDEYLTTENNWALAQNRSSLLTESKVHNYDVPRKRGATGNIRFSTSESFDASASSIIDLPKWTQTSTADSVSFVTIEASSLGTSDDYVDVACVQGEYKNYTTYAQGLAYETVIITNDSVDNDYYDLYVNNELWTKVDSLFDYDGTDKVYELKSLPDFSGVKATFGNGVYGKNLAENDKISFDYAETLGADGNILISDLVTTIDSTLYNLEGDQIDVYCTNPSSLSGGDDEASLEEIREDSPKFFQSGDRATTADDYETIIGEFSYIDKVSVIGAYEYNLDNGNDLWEYIPTEDNLVRVIALSTTGEGLTESERIQLTTDIRSKNAPTDILTYPDITVIPMRFNIDVVVKSTAYTLATVKSNIDTNLEETFGIDTMNFFESVYNSDMNAIIDNTDGVKYHTTYISLLEQLSFASAYATSVALPLYPIQGEYISVYIKTTDQEDTEYELIGTGDALGFIIGEMGYTFSSLSRINLTTGLGTIAITDGLEEDYEDYDVRVEYRITTDNITLTDRTQILKYDSSSYIGASYYTS